MSDNLKHWVKAGDKWVDVEETEFLDISEGITGQDVMVFTYDGEKYESPVYQGYYAPN